MIQNRDAHRGTVLVVEDDDRSRRLIVEILRDADYLVVDAATGERGLKELRRPRVSFDLMILDIQLPGVDGLTVAREVRRDARFKAMPVLAVTALPQQDAAVHVLEAGCDAYLAKPINVRRVQEMVERLIQHGRESYSLAREEQLPSFAGGRYAMRRSLGEGARKRVYLAHDSLLDRDVALAVIKSEGLDDVGRERILREAQAMARLGDHPNIVPVLDLGNEHGKLFIVSQYMRGGDVASLLRMSGGALSVERTLAIAKDICSGLEFAHNNNVVHRDLKPLNVWLTDDGTAKIGDFGIAVSLDRTRLTQEVGATPVGTVSYMPPEQAVGGDVTPRSDLYSLGAMLYELVTGRPPFVSDDPWAVISQHLTIQPDAPSSRTADCPIDLDMLILRLLEKDPSQRPGSVAEVLSQLVDLSADLAAE